MSFRNILIGLDQFLNTLIGGYPDETISAKAWRMETFRGSKSWGYARRVIDWAFSRVEPNHCEAAYDWEVLHNQSPTAYRHREKGGEV